MTLYRLAASPRDYAAVHDLIKAEGFPEHRLSFPTIMAWKENELVGILATNISNETIFAGPMVLKSGGPRRLWTMIRLIENYERVMREAGVSQFLFSVPMELKTYLYQIEEVLKLKPYAEKDGHKFFVRNL